MSKKFDVNAIVAERRNELDNSPLFQSKKPAPQRIAAVTEDATADVGAPPPDDSPNNQARLERASTLSREQASLQSSNHASMLSLSPKALEFIRKIVINPGKQDVLYVRLTKEEKDKLADVTYIYKRRGVKTSDNELVRVAVNALLEDYKALGENSLLSIIIASLHA